MLLFILIAEVEYELPDPPMHFPHGLSREPDIHFQCQSTLYFLAVSSLLKFLTFTFCISGHYMYYPTQYRAATASLFEKATSMFSQRIQQLEEDRTRTEVKYDESPRLYVTF